MNATRSAALCFIAVASVLLPLTGSASDVELEAGFRNPPNEARPRVWWHWMNGNVTKEGITADLAWMKRVGIAGLQNFDASLDTPQVVDERLAFMTPKWQDAFKHTAALAAEHDLELAIATSAGWSQTGGPWVTPDQAMKKVVWSTAVLEGGQRREAPLPLPPGVAGPFQDVPYPSRTPTPLPTFYADTHVIAFRAPPDEIREARTSAHIVGPAGALDAALLQDGSLAKALEIPVESGTSWIRFDYPQPVTIRAITLAIPVRHGFGAPPQFHATLEASDDGASFRPIVEVAPSRADQRTVSFPAVEARTFRVVFKAGEPFSRPIGAGVVPMRFPPVPQTIAIAELDLHQRMRIHRFVEKAGFAAAPDYYAIDTPAAPASSIVRKEDVVDLTTKLDRDGRLDWTAPPGRWIVLRMGYSLTGHMNGPATEEATGLEVDKLNARHVRAYMDRYLDMYERTVGKDLIGARGLRALLTDSYEAGAQNWTEGMLDEFARRRGYDARPWLPTLAGWIVASAHESDRFLWDFRRTIAELLAEAHYGQIKAAAQARGLVLYGEALEDQRPALGDDLAMRRHADVPMAAMWMHPGRSGPNPTYIADHRGAASVAHIYGQNVAAAESLTSFGYPWAFSPRDLQPVADLQFALGINRIVIHTSVHQPFMDRRPGMSLRTLLGQYFGRTETWAEQARPWLDYLARSSFLLQQGRYVADVAYFYGQEAPITGLYGREASTSQPADQPVGYGFDFVNDDVILNALRVEDGMLATASGMRYRILYLGGSSERMTLDVVRRLDALVRAGATLVGAPPTATPSLADDPNEFERAVAALWGTQAQGRANSIRSHGKGRVIDSMPPHEALSRLGIAPDFELRGAKQSSDVMFLHRRLADADVYFISNRTDRQIDGEAVFRVHGKRPEAWDAELGTIADLSYRFESGHTVVPLQLAPLRSTFVVFRRAASEQSWQAPRTTESVVAVLANEWDVEFEVGQQRSRRVTLNPLRSWTEHAEPEVRYFSGSAVYRNTFVIPRQAASDERFILDLGDVCELASVTINGKEVATVWRPPFRVDITEAVVPGRNEISARVTNLWVNRLIGDAQPGVQPQAFTTGPTYLPDAPLRSSGLLGPVRLLRSRPVASGTGEE